jgi:CRISPR/Cas system CMR-associated protein Cmr5 small subunit
MLRSTVNLIQSMQETIDKQAQEIETLKRKHQHISTSLFDARIVIRELKQALKTDVDKPRIRRVA